MRCINVIKLEDQVKEDQGYKISLKIYLSRLDQLPYFSSSSSLSLSQAHTRTATIPNPINFSFFFFNNIVLGFFFSTILCPNLGLLSQKSFIFSQILYPGPLLSERLCFSNLGKIQSLPHNITGFL